MKKQNLIAIITVIFALLGAATLLSDISRPITHKRADDFAFVDTGGNRHTFYTLSNKTVIIHFWATWCAPCLTELPQLLDVVEKNPDITLIAVSVDDNIQSMRRFLDPLPRHERIIHVWDEGRDVTKRFNIKKFPETLIFDQNYRLLQHVRGVADWDDFHFSD
jgi:thiol-disulfide isomerase/thioredoxin